MQRPEFFYSWLDFKALFYDYQKPNSWFFIFDDLVILQSTFISNRATGFHKLAKFPILKAADCI